MKTFIQLFVCDSNKRNQKDIVITYAKKFSKYYFYNEMVKAYLKEFLRCLKSF